MRRGEPKEGRKYALRYHEEWKEEGAKKEGGIANLAVACLSI